MIETTVIIGLVTMLYIAYSIKEKIAVKVRTKKYIEHMRRVNGKKLRRK